MIKENAKRIAMRELRMILKETGIEKRIINSVQYKIERSMCIRYTTTKKDAIRDICTWLFLKDREKYLKYAADIDITFFSTKDYYKNPYKYNPPTLIDGAQFIIRLDTFAFCKVIMNAQMGLDPNGVTFRGGKSLDLVDNHRLTILFTGKDVTKYYEEFKEDIVSSYKLPSKYKTISCSHRLSTKSIHHTVIARYKDDIFLNDRVKHDIFNYIDKWEKDSEFYYNRKMPHKLGILLSGVPGTGKSSLITTIGSVYDRRITYVDNIDDELTFSSRVTGAAVNQLVAFEDVDKLIINDDGTPNNRVIRRLMQILDSSESGIDTMFILTSNTPDIIRQIAPALLRRGRIDKEFNIGLLEEKQCRKMAEYYNVDWELVKDFKFPAVPVEFRSKLLDIRYGEYE